MNEIDDIKRRAGITEGNSAETEALISSHAILHRLYMDIREGKLDDDREHIHHVGNTLKRIGAQLEKLNKFTGMNVPR